MGPYDMTKELSIIWDFSIVVRLAWILTFNSFLLEMFITRESSLASTLETSRGSSGSTNTFYSVK